MNRSTKAFAVLAAVACLSGCGNSSEVDTIIAQRDSSSAAVTSSDYSAPTKSPDQLGGAVSPDSLSNGEFDIDLTQLSSTMVYSQVYDMVYKSDDYVGKSVRVKGPFSYFKDPNTGKEYFAVLITDATACCSQGMEFVLDGDFSYPDDYPEQGTEITVTGKFNYYKEDQFTYCQLTGAKMSV